MNFVYTQVKGDMFTFIFVYSGADLEGARVGCTPLNPPLQAIQKNGAPIKSDNLYCWRPQVQYFLNPRLIFLYHEYSDDKCRDGL